MKPHHLRMEAFGPYAEPTAINFDALSDEGLFLIHGSTGAGKTFLLDALCFALYGEVSGDRNVKALKSDHADPAAVPRVSLVFSCGGGRYRVERSPAYTAPKARGSGFTEKASQAVLFRLNGSEAEPIASRTAEVSREVEQLVGLNAAQFRQVILLPQGRFAEVLRAKADEREALLKTLFDTVAFEQAGFWLEDQAKAARLELAERNRAQEQLRRQAVQAWSPFAGPPAAGDAPPQPEEKDRADEAVDLDHLLAQMAAVVDATAQRLQQATAALTAAQAAQAEQQRLADRWDRRAAAAAKRSELEGKRELVDDYRQRLRRAERAEDLRPSVEAQLAAQADLNQLQDQIQAQLRAAIRARDGAQGLPQPVLLLDLMALPGLEALDAARNALASRRAELTALARRAAEAAQERDAAAAATRLAAAAEAQQARDCLARDALQQQWQAVSDAGERARSARDQLDGLRRAAGEARDRAQAAEALLAAQTREQQAIAAKNDADGACNRSQAALLELRRRQIAGMAARLAAGLEEGGACPVCGSPHHPAPAQPQGDAVADAAITAAERQLNTASAAAQAAAAAVATARGERKALQDKAGAAADDPLAARAAATTAAEALQAAQALAAQLEGFQEQIREHERQLQLLQGAIQSASTQQALQAQAAADAARRAEQIRAELAGALGEGVDPRAALLTLAPLEAALKQLAGNGQACSSAEARLEQAAARLARELAGSEFGDLAAVQGALQPESWRQRLAERIEAFGKALIEVEGLLASADLAGLPEQRPDTGAAQQAVTLADASRTAAVERHSEARGARSALERLAEEHRRGAAALAATQERARLLSAVADRCTGRAAPYISLQRWVLSAYLAEICRYANQRLELMTSGRYQLRLSDEGGRGGRNAGLGLRVLDAYTGEEREVSSLSGGETFQASLALALGVADTVQAHAGGVHLDALFIDEGFGSLDPDNLQLAMDELDRLRDGGRMIGVISHVGGLKERIRVGIAITAGETGSRATLCRTATAS
ncbi:MAG: SMC family ATPase [Synechococcaceae bacterium WB8_1B_136]|nr:SMC family ATPase [Synechococcaceae bacterium WB8_1B_136]